MKLRDLPRDEQPRERANAIGLASLTQRELLSILLRTGTRDTDALELADTLLKRFGDVNGILRASLSELCALRGMGRVRAMELKAAIEIGRRTSLPLAARRQIRTPGDAAHEFVHLLGALEQEEVWIMPLDSRNRALTREMVYRGSLNSASMRVAEVFKAAIRANAAAVILVHNHPSGDPTPSNDDVRVTRELIKAGRLLEVNLLDHIVVGSSNYVSLKERRLGFGDE
jgi:DNA repair protein RadC